MTQFKWALMCTKMVFSLMWESKKKIHLAQSRTDNPKGWGERVSVPIFPWGPKKHACKKWDVEPTIKKCLIQQSREGGGLCGYRF